MCKPKIKRMGLFLNFFTFGIIIGITIAPFGIYIKEKHFNNQNVVNHEKIHWRQQLELLIFFFYVWYLIEWLIRNFTNFGHAYENISFKREANINENNLEYLTKRKLFSFLKYFRNKN